MLVAAVTLTLCAGQVGPESSSPMAPVVAACTVGTLERSTGCLFDGRPRPAPIEGQRAQAEDNVRVARQVGTAICTNRVRRLILERSEERGRLDRCASRTTDAAKQCQLSGQESVLDAEGRFSTHARGCYAALAAAVQSADLPLLVGEAP